MSEEANYKRWYDHDPLLLEVIELLKFYQKELRSQAEVFLTKIEDQVSKETIDKYFNKLQTPKGHRWYDEDPVLYKTIELLRVIPPDIQRQAAQKFLDSLKQMGLDPEVIKKEYEK